MRIAFRTDASLQIGTGHVIRCLTLADSLREQGAQIIFICRPHDGHLISLIKQNGHPVLALAPADQKLTLPADPKHAHWLGTTWESDAGQTQEVLGGGQVLDWLVVDHYGIDRRWEESMRPITRRILVIDDLADRPHDCDLLLDQNLGRRAEHYRGLFKRPPKTLIGPEFALLRHEFLKWRDHSLKRRKFPELKNLLITMGGVDQYDATSKALDALKHCDLPTDLSVTVVMGPNAPWLAEVQSRAATMTRRTQVLAGVSNMAQLMAQSDLCIGAAGSTSWERCCLGVPTIQLIMAPNQKETALSLRAHGAAWVAVNFQQLICQLSTLFRPDSKTDTLREMSQSAAQLVEGYGVSKVIQRLMELHG